MTTTTRTIRVFISSTFSDLKAERNALQERVFPRLKRYCQRRGWSFQAIDLRWGVTKEQAENDQVLDVCFRQIDECRQFFVGLRGERYGWEAASCASGLRLADKWGKLGGAQQERE